MPTERQLPNPRDETERLLTMLEAIDLMFAKPINRDGGNGSKPCSANNAPPLNT